MTTQPDSEHTKCIYIRLHPFIKYCVAKAISQPSNAVCEPSLLGDPIDPNVFSRSYDQWKGIYISAT